MKENTLMECRKYADMLAEDGYKLRPAFDLQSGMTITDVAKAALTPASLARWAEAEKAAVQELREKYGLEPVDKHDTVFDEIGAGK